MTGISEWRKSERLRVMIRVCLQRSEPEDDGGESDHGGVGDGQLLVAGRDAAELFEAIDATFGPIALSVSSFPSRAGHLTSATPGALVLSRIVAMATDNDGRLWYVRAGSDQIEMVQA